MGEEGGEEFISKRRTYVLVHVYYYIHQHCNHIASLVIGWLQCAEQIACTAFNFAKIAMEQEHDTDLLLAMLSSLLQSPLPSEQTLLDVLVECNGDVQTAAKLLQPVITAGSSPSSPRNIGSLTPTTIPLNSRKRKREHTYLDRWLQKQSTSESHQLLSSSAITHQTNPSSLDIYDSSLSAKNAETSFDSSMSVPKLQINYTSVLRPPLSKGSTIPRQLPLTLTSPKMVAEHTPCSLHYSILPQELACSLFYAMMDESESWSRNKWWLFDRLVESPHRTSFFIREGSEKEEGQWKEETQFWCVLIYTVTFKCNKLLYV